MLFHSNLTSSVKFIESSNGFLCPHNLCGKKRNLSAVILKPFVSLSVRDLPVISSCFGLFKLISKVNLHASLKITKVVLDGSSHQEFCTKWNKFTFFREHSACSLRWIWNSWSFYELKASHSIETISKIVINFFWVVTVGKDIKKSLVRNEIESSENLFLLFKIFIQGFLAKLNLFEEVLEKFLSSFMSTGSDDAWFILGFSHHISELVVNCLESSCVIWKLCSDIFRSAEDWLKSLPISLGFSPDLDNRVNGLKIFLPVHDFFLELFDIFGGHHSHEFHGVLLNEFNNFVHSSKNWVFIPLLEHKNLSFPNG